MDPTLLAVLRDLTSLTKEYEEYNEAMPHLHKSQDVAEFVQRLVNDKGLCSMVLAGAATSIITHTTVPQRSKTKRFLTQNVHYRKLMDEAAKRSERSLHNLFKGSI